MTPELPHLALHHTRRGYVVVNSHWSIESYGGATDLLHMDETCFGTTLWEHVPELMDAKGELLRVLHHATPQLHLNYLSQEFGGAHTHTEFTVLPYADATCQPMLLIIASDETEHTAVIETLVGQHEELAKEHALLAEQQNELQDANAELQRVDAIKTTALSMATHELRTPLTAIMGNVELLLEDAYGPLQPEQRTTLLGVQHSACRMRSITTELLDVARIEAGALELSLQQVDLEHEARMIMDEHRMELAARDQDVTLHSASNLPPLMCDKTRLAQVLSNLLDNAIKYTPNGGNVAISISQTASADGVRIAVQDTGIGIAPYEQARVFQRFFRASNGKNAGISGTGLGLYITHALVEMHGGRIWVESELNKGSTFYVYLPNQRRPASVFGDGRAAQALYAW